MAIPILNSIDVKGQVRVDGGSGAYGQIEVGGQTGGIIDLKAPYSDDYDLRLHASSSAHEITTASGSLVINTGNTLAMTIEADQDVLFEEDIRTKEDLLVDGVIYLKNDGTKTGPGTDLHGPYISGSNTSIDIGYDGNSSGIVVFKSHNQNGGAAINVMQLPACENTSNIGDNDVLLGSNSGQVGISAKGHISHEMQKAITITHSSGVHTVDFKQRSNYYIINPRNGTNSIAFSNLDGGNYTDVAGQTGTIVINNPASVGSLSWSSPALPATAYTPGGSAITFNTTANRIAVMTYFVVAYNKVLINYVGNFDDYPQ